MEKFQPLSEKSLERLHKTLRKLRRHKKPFKVKVLGKLLLVLPGVFSPEFIDSVLLAKNVRKRTPQNSIVLDLGTGSGIQAIFAAENARKVIATDISSKAIKCAKQNAERHLLESKIEVRKGYLFQPIKKSEKFDLIIFNPPFRNLKPRNELEMALTDRNYKALSQFFKQAKRFLKRNGRILLAFSTVGDEKFLRKIIAQNGFSKKQLERTDNKGFQFFVLEITPRKSKK